MAGPSRVFYFDPQAGIDSNDGLSTTTPKRNYGAIQITSNTVCLQKAGSVYRGPIYIRDAVNVRLSSYGEGVPPRITNSYVCTDWISDTSTGAYHIDSGNYLVLEDGRALLRVYPSDDSTTPVLKPGSFSFTKKPSRVFYMPSSGKPSDHCVEVAASDQLINVRGVSQLEIDHLELYGFGIHGISAQNVSESRLHDLVIHDGGGANDYCGNGIEISFSSHDVEVDHNVVYSIFDSGISPQVFTDRDKIARVKMHDNFVSSCGMDAFEVTAHSAFSRLTDIQVFDNAIYRCGIGWSGNRGGRGVCYNSAVRMGKDTDDTFVDGIVRHNSVSDCLGGLLVVGHCRVAATGNSIDGGGKGFGVHARALFGEARLTMENNVLRDLKAPVIRDNVATGSLVERASLILPQREAK